MATSVRRDLDLTKRTVENAESRARLQARAASKPLRGNNRQYAQALHRQADELCQRGEYESALVLYHRAATVCPHDSSHNVAARRTAAAISSWNNPERNSTRVFKTSTRVVTRSNSAAFGVRDAKSPADLAISPKVLRVSRETLPALGPLTSRLTSSRTMLEHVNGRADATLKSLRASFQAGEMRASLRLAEDLLALAPDLEDPRRHRIPAYHYLSLIHTAVGRHDRASSSVAALVRLARSTGDIALLSWALVTLGKVHLSFGHLKAAARAWENMAVHVDHPVPRAWLHHEIGRCHLERGMYVKALHKAAQCRECAALANSKKWRFHAGLLTAQCLAMLGRFDEALEELRTVGRISEEEGDTPALSYIRDLIEQLNRAVREVTFGEDRCLKGGARRELSAREEPERVERDEAIITTSGIKGTTCSSDGIISVPPSSSSLSLQPADLSSSRPSEAHDRCEAGMEDSSSLDSAASFGSEGTSLTYVVVTRTDSPSGEKTPVDERRGMSRDSRAHSELTEGEENEREETLVSVEHPIDARSGDALLPRATGADCETFRIAWDEGERRGVLSVATRRGEAARASHVRSPAPDEENGEPSDGEEDHSVRDATSD